VRTSRQPISTSRAARVVGNQQHPADEPVGRGLLEDRPVAEAGRIVARDPVRDEAAMLGGVVPRAGDVPRHFRIAIHLDARVEIGEHARAQPSARSAAPATRDRGFGHLDSCFGNDAHRA
jgi:hypothetical protein